jgi:hypothetical protein
MTSIVQLTARFVPAWGQLLGLRGLDVTTGILEDGCVDGAGVVEGYTAEKSPEGPKGPPGIR